MGKKKKKRIGNEGSEGCINLIMREGRLVTETSLRKCQLRPWVTRPDTFRVEEGRKGSAQISSAFEWDIGQH